MRYLEAKFTHDTDNLINFINERLTSRTHEFSFKQDTLEKIKSIYNTSMYITIEIYMEILQDTAIYQVTEQYQGKLT